MKRINILTLVILSIILILSLQPASLATAASASNLISNPSLETNSNNLPIGWTKDSYGANIATYTYNNFGHTGSKSASIKMSNYVTGDAKWIPTSVTVTPNTKYTFSDWYQSTAITYIYAVYDTTANTTVYKYLAYTSPSTAWKNITYTFTTPANAKTVTIYHFINSNGTLTIDDYSLTTVQAPTAPSAPVTTVTLNSTKVLATVTPVTCEVGTAQYQTRSRINDGDWGSWTAWSTKLTATRTSTIGVKYGYQARARCYISSSSYSAAIIGAENTYVRPIATPMAPVVTASTAGNTTIWSWAGAVCAANTTARYQYDYTVNSGYDSGWIVTNGLSVANDTSSTGQTYTVSVQAQCYNTNTVSSWSVLGQANYYRPVVIPPPDPVSTNLILNNSIEQSVNNNPTNWTSANWAVNTGTNTYESTGHTGTHSLKTTISTYSAGDAFWYFDPVAIVAGKTYSFSDYYKSSADTEIDIMVNFNNGTTNYYYLGMAASSPSGWNKITGEFTMPAGAVSATIYQALAQVGYVQTDDYSLTEYQPQKFNRALLSIDFDDGWRSVYQNALPILNKYGLVTTQYILTDTFNDPEHMTIAMIQVLKDQDSEISSHSVSHRHLTTLSAAELTNELFNSQAILQQTFGNSGVANNFASPFGEYNTTVINEIKKYYSSHRSVDTGFNSKDTFNIYNIKVQNIVNTTTIGEIQGWINEALNTNTWLVLVYHEVGTTYDGTKFTTATNDFDAQMNAIKQSGIVVETTNQALDEIVPQL